MFQPVQGNAEFPALEEEVLAFWKAEDIFRRSVERRRREGAERFVFYEGPPTANGLPHPGHCLTRAIKDLFPRYRTMRGQLCERKGGWDTHGLPVEVEVCKELGIHAKEEIEAYGVEPFIHRCRESVWRYMQEWERNTERLGFWIDLGEAYVTYHQSYVESVWWSLKTLFDRGLLYQGHKIVWWWAQGGTALSSGEVGQGYREVADPSVYVKFPLLDDEGNVTNTSLLVWTTTPWTLPSNQFVAVHPELEYATVVDRETGERLIMASALVETIAGKVKRELTIESTYIGTKLLGRRYVPPFDYYYRLHNQQGQLKDGRAQFFQWRVVAADFVTLDSGTGVVHEAPAFGEVDYDLLRREQNRFNDHFGLPGLLNAVAPDGKFTSAAPDYEGRWVKDCDKDICRDLKRRGLLFHQEQYLHDYPFCWRAEEDPLIQYPRRSWFVKTTQYKEKMLANNEQVNWLPEHIKHGRFGNFLETNVDWALSRERFWGTPLPIWVCDKTGRMEAVGSYAELLAKPGGQGAEVWEGAKEKHPDLPDDLKVHKPYIDAITYDSPFEPGGRMRRVPDVIDCWYDSGAMPFAQWGYPHQNQEKFTEQFPADFISEALDQTRGWFYSQLAISTLLFGDGDWGLGIGDWGEEGADAAADSTDTPQSKIPSSPNPQSLIPNPSPPNSPYPHPFKNCIVLGLMLGEDGTKMSKSKRNYREPQEIFDRYGADALRWYFFAGQPPWSSIVYSERAIRESIPEFLRRLWNVFGFFVNYARLDGFNPAELIDGDAGPLDANALSQGKHFRPIAERAELDRWLLSELNRTARVVIERMDAFENYPACAALSSFVDALSNWYVRRGRARYWSADKSSQDKFDAYWTLYECLLTLAKLIAPFTPFLAEAMWQNLAGVFKERAAGSVHLCDYPQPDESAIDEHLSERMRLLRDIASLGLSVRAEKKLAVRQPLSKAEVMLASGEHQAWLEEHDGLLRDELNVKQIEYTKEADKYIDYSIVPNFKRLGPRLGKLMPRCKKALASADGGRLLAELSAQGKVTLTLEGETIELDDEDLEVRLAAKPGWAAAQSPAAVVVLATELTADLVREGQARTLVRLVNDRRKALDLAYNDRIELAVVTDAAELLQAFEENRGYIEMETQADSFTFAAIAGVPPAEGQIDDQGLMIFVRRVDS